MFIEPNSPVRATFRWIESFLISDPCPDLKTDASRSAAILIATHLLHTLQAAGNLNVSGFHSAAVVLFRPLEDALDCFAAVLLVESNAVESGDNLFRFGELGGAIPRGLSSIR